jgi:hypothetical protein
MECVGDDAAESGRDLRSDAVCLATALLPVLVSAGWKAFVRPRPFWAFFYDPESFYFHDGLRLLHGHPPLDYTHPGTPVQALSALVALATAATHVTPERFDAFRGAAYCLGWALQLLGAIALLRTVLTGLPATLRIAALVTYFLAAKSLEYETVWSPELLYFAVGTLALAATWRALDRRFDFSTSLAAGAAVGLACAVKFLFLPWVLAACLIALLYAGPRPGRLRAAAVTTVAAGLAFVVATLPAAGRYSDMVAWVARLASRSGRYGDAPHALPAVSTLLSNSAALLSAAKGWYLWLLLAAIGAWLAWRHHRNSDEGRRLGGLAAFSVTALVLGHLLVVRGPSAHYLLPAAAAAVGLVAVAARAPQLEKSAGLRWAALLLAAVLFGKHLLADGSTHLSRNRMAEASRRSLMAAVARQAPPGRQPVVVYGYGTPMPSLALRYFATDPQLLQGVEELYPGEGHLGPGDRLRLPAGAHAWDVMVVQRRDAPRVTPVLGAAPVEHVGAWEVLLPASRVALVEGHQ